MEGRSPDAHGDDLKRRRERTEEKEEEGCRKKNSRSVEYSCVHVYGVGAGSVSFFSSTLCSECSVRLSSSSSLARASVRLCMVVLCPPFSGSGEGCREGRKSSGEVACDSPQLATSGPASAFCFVLVEGDVVWHIRVFS